MPDRFTFASRPCLPVAIVKAQIDAALAEAFGAGTVTLEFSPANDPAPHAWLDAPADWVNQPTQIARAEGILNSFMARAATPQ